MNPFIEWGEQGLRALVQLLLNPFYYIGIAFIVLQYRRQISLERKLFNSRLHSFLGEAWRTLLWGWLGGLMASVLMILFGVTLPFNAMLLIWAIAFLLMLARVRYFCIAYSVGVLGILHFIALVAPVAEEWPVAGWVFHTALSVNMPSLLALAGVLHLVEGLLMRWQGSRLAMPLFLESKRGKLVGAYHLQGFWPVPLFLLVPSQSGMQLPWNPWFIESGSAAGWGIIAFPALIGFTSSTLSRLPAWKARFDSTILMGYSIIILAGAIGSYYWSPFILPASLLVILLHEGMIAYSNRKEESANPMYVHDSRGLKILAVLPQSPAAELGIQAGEIIHKVNQIKVATKEEFHQAMQANSAFCKLEIINLEGHSKFVSRAVFAGEHHQLGLILCPDDKAMYYVEQRPVSIFAYFRKKKNGLRSHRSSASS
ncbi:PDZ domain-containing protein [Paenibacillus sp. J2TS4]|uniref:PDZ domain-containing protein n=1 Tax=Paenibacillus sp. J2TS4 TaxID=2807194 RepID=UPI001AFE3785|nr:PDZ domain-containing protein [Paenibacillus sp. J2TS4]GIP35635.1 cell division topological determinant MinJ [Paenibacillus sp. J2TS4]